MTQFSSRYRVLLVVDESIDGALIEKFSARFSEVQQLQVETKALDSIEAESVEEFDLVVACTSHGSSLKLASIPVIVCHPAALPEFGMTLPEAGKDFGFASYESVAVSSKLGGEGLAAGLIGRQTISTGDSGQGWGKPAASAQIVATLPGNATRATLFAYNQWDQMRGLIAPHRRVAFLIGGGAGTALLERGWSLFDAAVDFALRGGPLRTPPSQEARWFTDKGEPTMAMSIGDYRSWVNQHISGKLIIWITGAGFVIGGSFFAGAQSYLQIQLSSKISEASKELNEKLYATSTDLNKKLDTQSLQNSKQLTEQLRGELANILISHETVKKPLEEKAKSAVDAVLDTEAKGAIKRVQSAITEQMPEIEKRASAEFIAEAERKGILFTLLAQRLEELISKDSFDPDTRHLALQLGSAFIRDEREWRVLLLRRLATPKEDPSITQFAMQHFPPTNDLNEIELVDGVLKTWESNRLSSEASVVVPTFVGKFSAAWADRFLAWSIAHADRDEAHSVIRGLATVKGDAVVSKLKGLVVLNQPAGVRALGWLGMINIAKNRKYDEEEKRREVLRVLLTAPPETGMGLRTEELPDDAMKSILGADVRKEDIRVAGGRQLTAREIWQVAIENFIRVSDWDILPDSELLSAKKPGKESPTGPPQLESRIRLSAGDREALETALQSWGAHLQNDDASLSSQQYGAYLVQLFSKIPEPLAWPQSAKVVAILVDRADMGSRLTFIDVLFERELETWIENRSAGPFPGAGALAAALRKAFREGRIKGKAVSLSRKILQRGHVSALAGAVVESAKGYMNDGEIRSLVCDACDPEHNDWTTVSDALAAMAAITDVDALPEAFEKVALVLRRLEDVQPAGPQENESVWLPGDLVPGIRPQQIARADRDTKRRALDQAIATLRQWATIDRARQIVLEKYSGLLGSLHGGASATLRDLLIELRRARVKELWGKQRELVEKDLRELAKLDPTNGVWQFNLGAALEQHADQEDLTLQERRGLLQEALIAYGKAKDHASTNTKTLRARGRAAAILANLGRRAEARHESEEAVKIAPDGPEAWLEVAIQHSELRHYDAAVSAFDRAIEDSRNDAAFGRLGEAYYDRGLAHRGLGQFELAIKDLNAAMQNWVTPTGASDAFAWIYLQSGKYDEALRSCEQAIRASDQSSGYLCRGMVKRCQGKDADAIEDFKNAIKSRSSACNGDFVRAAHIALARAESAVGMREQAQRDFEFAASYRVEGEEPDYDARAQAEIELGKYSEALSDCQAQRKIDPTDPEALSLMGYAHFKKGELDKGLNEVNEALGMKPESLFAHLYRAEIYERKGKKPEAAADRKRANELGLR